MFFKKTTYDWLLVGLGNIGLQYEKTRHNAGFMAADCFAEKNEITFNKHKFDAVCGECKIEDMRILVIKPETYMNNSGKAVGATAAFYKIPNNKIIILQDDMMLDVGTVRIRRKGSDGGQKGIRDIIQVLGTEEIIRIKIGVGKKPHPDYDVIKWVLGKFPKEQTQAVDKALQTAACAAKEIMLRGIDSAMNKYSS